MILFFLFLLANVSGKHTLTGPKEVKQCAGKSLNVVCHYHSFYTNYVKYWCRGYYFNYCTILIRSDQSKGVSEPLEIIDSKNERFFTIHMRNVQKEDSGWYWCGIERVSRHKGLAMQLFISDVKAHQCFAPEPTTQNFKETTTLPTTQPTTSTATNSATTLLQSTLETFNSHIMRAETTPSQEINSTEILIFKIWMVTRWILFIAMTLFLSCFIACFELWFGRS